MKLTKRQLKRIIKEEIQKALKESYVPHSHLSDVYNKIRDWAATAKPTYEALKTPAGMSPGDVLQIMLGELEGKLRGVERIGEMGHNWNVHFKVAPEELTQHFAPYIEADWQKQQAEGGPIWAGRSLDFGFSHDGRGSTYITISDPELTKQLVGVQSGVPGSDW